MLANEMKFNFQLKFDSLFEFSAPAYDDRQISYLLTEAQYRVFIERYNPLGNKYQKGFEADEQRRRDLEQLIRPASISGTGVTGNIAYTGDTTIGSKIITSMSSVVGLNEGLVISGSGIPVGATIRAILSTSSIEISADSTITATGVTLVSGIGKSPVQGGVHPGGVFLDMPSGFLYAVEEAAHLSGQLKESMVRPVKHDEYLANINNPYKKPYKDLVWRMDISRFQHAEGTSIDPTPKRTELIIPSTYTLSGYRLRYLSSPPGIVVDEYDESNQRHCILDESLHRQIVDEAVAIAQAAVKPSEYQIGLNEKQRSE